MHGQGTEKRLTMRYFVDSNNLVFDLGMNNGEDTEYYLKKGYRVVAVEANPELCDQTHHRFAEDIHRERLVIVHGAIWHSCGQKTFFVNLDNDHWSSLDIGWAGRDASRVKKVDVDCVTLAHLFALYGVPRYLKIDVEGVDDLVLKQLMDLAYVPRYVSVEDCRFGFDYMAMLNQIGYGGFKLLDQSTVPGLLDDSVAHIFKEGASGPLGEDISGEWVDYERILQIYSTTVRDLKGIRLAPMTQWYDIHAACLDKKRII